MDEAGTSAGLGRWPSPAHDGLHAGTTIARLLVQARAAAVLAVERDVAVDVLLAERARLDDLGLPPPSLTDVVIKAAALALREHPRVNASWRDGSVVHHTRVHVGVAVAAPGTLLVPVVRNADTLPLGTIAWATRELARQARTGTLPEKATRGGTFTVSNLALFGVDAFIAVLDPAQAAVLAVGGVRSEPEVLDGELAERQVLRLRLTCDHRVLDDADASAFLEHVAGYLEAPLALAL